MPRARGSSPPRLARSAGYAAALTAESPWPPDDIRALISTLRADHASLEWEHLRLTLLRMAARLRSRYSDVPDEPDDIAQCVLLNFSEQDSLAQFAQGARPQGQAAVTATAAPAPATGPRPAASRGTR